MADRDSLEALGDAHLPELGGDVGRLDAAELGDVDAQQVGVRADEGQHEVAHRRRVDLLHRPAEARGHVRELDVVAHAAAGEDRKRADQAGRRAGPRIDERLGHHRAPHPGGGHLLDRQVALPYRLVGEAVYDLLDRLVRTADVQLGLEELLLIQGGRRLLGLDGQHRAGDRDPQEHGQQAHPPAQPPRLLRRFHQVTSSCTEGKRWRTMIGRQGETRARAGLPPRRGSCAAI